MNSKNFTTVDLTSQKTYMKCTSAYASYSDFNFVSLFCWNVDNSAEFMINGNNMIIKLPDYTTGETTYSILGKDDIDSELVRLFEITDVLKLVPEETVEHIVDKSAYQITEDPDNFDYICDVSKVASLGGGALKKKRNKVHKFVLDMGTSVRVDGTLDPTDSDKKELLSLFDKWTQENEDVTDLNTPEKLAFCRLVENFQDLNLILTRIYHNEQLSGFSVNELLGEGYAVCHFEKAMLIHDNIYTFVAQQVAMELAKHDVQFVNWEQDLGIPGLRQSKQSYQPVRMLKKYTITKA